MKFLSVQVSYYSFSYYRKTLMYDSLCLYMVTQTFKVLLFMALFLSEMMVFNIDVTYASIVTLSAIIGALCLEYFETRKASWIERFTKATLSSCLSLIFSPVFLKHYGVTDIQDVSAVYCVCSLIILTLLKTIVVLTRKNGKEIVISIITRFLPVPAKERQAKFNKSVEQTTIKVEEK